MNIARRNISQTPLPLTITMDLKQHLQKLECHFTWNLGCYKNELKTLLRNLEDVNQEKCIWKLHYYNLLGYIQQALGSDTKALEYLQKAESVMQEQGTEEAEVLLQVNKANLAWVYFHMGDKIESERYLENVQELQQTYPAPPGCALHPEVSGEKGWTLVKFNKSKKRDAIDYFKMALKAQPGRKEWHKGLAIAMSRGYTFSNCHPQLIEEILMQLKIAHENDPDNMFIHVVYLEKLYEVQREENERQMQALLEKTLETEDLDALGTILRYCRAISVDKAIEAAEGAQKKFPTSNRVLKHRANCYKWKVYNIKEDNEERRTLARYSVELFEKVVKLYPDSLREYISLASMHKYAGNSMRADDIYQQLLKMKDDLPPHSKQYIYYSYACHLHRFRRLEDSINFHMKVAEIPGDSIDKQKSIKILIKSATNRRNPCSEKIRNFLETIQIDD